MSSQNHQTLVYLNNLTSFINDPLWLTNFCCHSGNQKNRYQIAADFQSSPPASPSGSASTAAAAFTTSPEMEGAISVPSATTTAPAPAPPSTSRSAALLCSLFARAFCWSRSCWVRFNFSWRFRHVLANEPCGPTNTFL